MKHSITSALLLLISISTFSQTYNLLGMQGIKSSDGNLTLELSGYDIYISTEDGDLEDEIFLNDIKYNLGMENIEAEYSESNLNVENKTIEAEAAITTNPYLRTAQTCFLLKKSSGKITSILFLTINERDRQLELTVVEEYLKNELTPYIIKNKSNKSFTFLGRNISPKVKWEMNSPHIVTGEGVQIRWSEFKTTEDAATDLKNRLMLDKNDMKVLMEGNVEVLFEGVTTSAYRVAYNDEYSSYPLIVYYIAQNIRGRYTSCIMSNYGHNKDDYYLNPLLGEVMSIPQLPANAFRLPEPEQEPEYVSRPPISYIPANWLDFQIGTRLPIGNLSKAYSSATMIALYIKMFSIKSTIFDIGIQAAFPSKVKEFRYYFSDRDYDITEPVVFVNLNVRARWEKYLASNLRLQYYVGLGYEGLSTDLSAGSYVNDFGDEIDYTHSVGAMDLFGGINLKHKYIGFFVEYHYTPYSMSGRVKSDFGNSAMHAGVLVTF